MSKYYAAVDVGASSGRLILGWMEDGCMKLEEVHRFENGMVRRNGSLCWEFDRIYSEIVTALKKCREIGKIPSALGVDTWGVDFVLLDAQDRVVGDTVGYRDQRTNGMDEEVYRIVPEKELYERTGIQKALFNTIFAAGQDKMAFSDECDAIGDAIDHGESFDTQIYQEDIELVSNTLATDMLVAKFLQGFTFAGVIGGPINLHMVHKVSKIAKIKYKKRFLNRLLIASYDEHII